MFTLRRKASYRDLLSLTTRNKRRQPPRRRRKKEPKPEPIPLVTGKKGVTQVRKKGLLDYKNLSILRQYLNVRGKILPRSKTRLTASEQRKVARTIKTARVIGFLPFVRR